MRGAPDTEGGLGEEARALLSGLAADVARELWIRGGINWLVARNVHERAVGAGHDQARDVVLARDRAGPRVRGEVAVPLARRVEFVGAPDLRECG